MTGPKIAPAPTKDKELVLPSGVFARVRSITVGDMAGSDVCSTGVFHVLLVSRITTFDGVSLTPDELAKQDYEEVAPLFVHVYKELHRIVQIAHGYTTT